MRVDWKNVAESPTDEQLSAFERLHDVELTEEHRWFLQNVANGGRPVAAYLVPTTDCPGGAAALHGVYGISHPLEYYDLGQMIAADPERTRCLFPFGYDDVGGNLFIDLRESPGRIVYNPGDPDELYFSADSIHTFLENLTHEDDL